MAEPGQRCSHPWLRVTCGVCGDAVDALGETPPDPVPAGAASRPSGGADPPRPSEATFIVARGHPELIDQLRALLGHDAGVQIIEDRRKDSREEVSTEAVRELRKRLREDGETS